MRVNDEDLERLIAENPIEGVMKAVDCFYNLRDLRKKALEVVKFFPEGYCAELDALRATLGGDHASK